MDFNASMDILMNRSTMSDNDDEEHCSCSRNHLTNIISSSTTSTSSQSIEALMKLSDLELINFCIALQSERIQTYIGYNSALDALIETKTLREYPHLCSELTSRFAVISQNVRIIKDIFIERKFNNIATVIGSIQEDEKEKLMLIAAQHLDKIQDSFPELKLQSNSNVTVFSQPSYNNERIQSIEVRLAEHMENLQAYKVDIVESLTL